MKREIIEQVSKELNISPKLVGDVYNSYWKAVRHIISSFPLKESSIEDLEGLRLSLNIPSIGKFYVNKDKLKRRKNGIYKNKKIKTSIHNSLDNS